MFDKNSDDNNIPKKTNDVFRVISALKVLLLNRSTNIDCPQNWGK